MQVGGLTEITSNVATANILLPVLAEVQIMFSLSQHYNHCHPFPQEQSPAIQFHEDANICKIVLLRWLEQHPPTHYIL